MRFLFGKFFLPCEPLANFLRGDKSLMRKYKRFSIFKEDNIFWADEFFNSEEFSFAAKMSLVEYFYSTAWAVRRSETPPDALISWAYSNASGRYLEALCYLSPVGLNTLVEALSNENWVSQNFITMCMSIADEPDYRFEERREATMLLIKRLPSKVLSKTVIVKLLKFIESEEAGSHNLTHRNDPQREERILLNELGLTLKNVVVERVGGELPYDWAVRLLEED